MKAIDTRILISALGGVLIATGFLQVKNQPQSLNLIFGVVLAIIGAYLIYKGRFFY